MVRILRGVQKGAGKNAEHGAKPGKNNTKSKFATCADGEGLENQNFARELRRRVQFALWFFAAGFLGNHVRGFKVFENEEVKISAARDILSRA